MNKVIKSVLFSSTSVFLISMLFISCSDTVDKVNITNATTETRYSGASVIIDANVCYGCSQENCYVRCPAKAVSKTVIGNRTVYLIDPEMCIKCGICIKSCPFDAITWKH